jgi:hypothetical protein
MQQFLPVTFSAGLDVAAVSATASAYKDPIEAWRVEREATLREPA